MLSGSSATIASIARHVVQCAQLDSNDAHILIEDNVGEATLRAVPAFKRSPPNYTCQFSNAQGSPHI